MIEKMAYLIKIYSFYMFFGDQHWFNTLEQKAV
jgi:hypothetical protein